MLIPGKYSSWKKLSIEENHTSLNRYKKGNFNPLTFVLKKVIYLTWWQTISLLRKFHTAYSVLEQLDSRNCDSSKFLRSNIQHTNYFCDLIFSIRINNESETLYTKITTFLYVVISSYRSLNLSGLFFGLKYKVSRFSWFNCK